ncbi:MAG: amidohydrolase [Clostridiales bacterium]|nr:amidohydrolase [Clostridiales bacterium]
MENLELNNGFVKIKNNKISALGPMTQLPDTNDAQVIDACGGFILPGLVDAHTHLGIWEDSLGFEGDDGNEDTDPATPQLRAIDAINPFDRSFEEALNAGVTSVLSGPGSANPIAGQFAAFKTCGRRIDDMVLTAPIALKFALGENPKMAYHEKNQTPVTRMATAAIIRENLFKALEYAKAKEKAENDPDCDAPDFDMKLESILPLLSGEIKAHFHAHRADDIFTAIRISKEFKLKPVIIHGTEAHLIADILKDENIPIITGPSLSFRAKPELRNMTFETPGILAKNGVLTAITTDHPETPLSYLMLCASLANQSGMDEREALKAITINPAKIAGLDHRIGSIKEGKDADIVIYKKHPFERNADITAVIINGKRVR